MIKEDIEKEMKTTRADEAEDMAAYKQLYKDSMAYLPLLTPSVGQLSACWARIDCEESLRIETIPIFRAQHRPHSTTIAKNK